MPPPAESRRCAPAASAGLPVWLRYIEQAHPEEIELGLERVASVAATLDLVPPAPLIVTVGGTNGKGSCVALLETVLLRAGYRVGAYTSPHLLRFNERIRIDGRAVSDAPLTKAIAQIEQGRGAVRLTYFEYATLAAFTVFRRQAIEVAVLEVGMGGRLDAVNVADPDVAIVTSIGLDHCAWLGTDRASIAREKAGIFRSARPAICGDRTPPAELGAEAARIGARLLLIGHDFDLECGNGRCRWRGETSCYEDLPPPLVPGGAQSANAACALAALETLGARAPVAEEAIRFGLSTARAAGRFQVEPGAVEWIFDVAHNEEAAAELGTLLASRPACGRTHAIVGMLDDKPVERIACQLLKTVDAWHACPIDNPRGLSAAALAARLRSRPDTPVREHGSVQAACAAVTDAAEAGDRVLVFGSFHIVGPALAVRGLYSGA